MPKNSDQPSLALILGATCAVACQTKGPAPGQGTATERVEVTMAERDQGSAPNNPRDLGIPTDEYHRDYTGRLQGSPHKPGDLGVPDSHVSGPVKHVDVGGLQFTAPEGWEYEHPASAMRRAQLGVRSDEGTAGLVVYFFGGQGAGSALANIDRWVGQFKNPDGSPVTGIKPTERRIAGFKATQIEVAGTYVGGMGASSLEEEGRPGQRMIATIVDTPNGPYYFKLLGADETVSDNRKALEALLASMKASE